jgi:hypothetical protein
MSARRSDSIRAVTLVVTLFLALAATVVAYAFGQGGPVAGLIFFTILTIGAIIRLTEPIRARLRP